MGFTSAIPAHARYPPTLARYPSSLTSPAGQHPMHGPATTTTNSLKVISLLHHPHARSPEPENKEPIYKTNQLKGIYWKRLELFPKLEAVIVVLTVMVFR